ncbi:substrate-binding domain-containing protein [Criibacterium bergeronii]|uniref:Phosphate ABC transporter substrate-binding protein n=1 Tax=Criibacterium bergeronii TaxID=1871336 RepID=A0A371IJY5_9FIRM|nr:substrate-binding domain-containing protein [Criibacterium bergeronii]RDY20789.1 phosphate ABC transporter substrate-binding protein [Criibacterium bergeronii]TRW26081.1 phosphate ABC transporter substrate-binding protein [Criibacterium bergeronii]
MKLNKIVKGVFAVALVATLAACGGAKDATQTKGDAASQGEIAVISRESGSGTRGAFIELTKVEAKGDDGKKKDMTIDTAEIANSTNIVMTSVANNPAAIGYISLGSVNDKVKALKVDGVEATAAGVKDGSYKLSRPFNIATKGEASPEAQDFINFILSKQGQEVVEKEGYIAKIETPAEYTGNGMKGKITISGSSSVTPVMEKLKEAYNVINPDMAIQIQQSDSTTGMTDAINGISDIGMASRELKEEEKASLTPTVIALDGIAIIVNNENATTDMSMEQIKGVYTGEITSWDALAAK